MGWPYSNMLENLGQEEMKAEVACQIWRSEKDCSQRSNP
jgi:hypothetical protein